MCVEGFLGDELAFRDTLLPEGTANDNGSDASSVDSVHLAPAGAATDRRPWTRSTWRPFSAGSPCHPTSTSRAHPSGIGLVL